MTAATAQKLTIELVPKTCWYSNLRNAMPRSSWDKVRKKVYADYGHRCGVCSAANVRLNCHEIWEYDDQRHIQRLLHPPHR
jgi:hypothetical protein